MAITSPFEILQSLDRRCRANSSGMPTSKTIVNDWVGIGFSINNVSLVAKMDEVSEISPIPKTIRVPGVKTWVKGLANIRGALLPVLDMRAYLYDSATEPRNSSRILIINHLGLSAGLLVEEVFGMRRFKPEDCGDTVEPDLGGIQDYLTGSFEDQMRRWNVFSIDKLVKADEFVRVV